MNKKRRNFLLLFFVIGCCALLTLRALERFYREPDNFDLIEDRLYMGGYVLAPPSGTRAVLNLCELADRYECEVHVHDPIRDGAPAPSIDWLREKVAFIETQRRAGKPTYVHCMQGASRSGLVMAAYLMHEHGWSREEAVAFIRERRWQMRPNPAFMELLGEWERTLGAE